jgi:hypothetical protein
MDCSYDGGDCCGCNVQTDYCDVCGCLDPNGSGGGTTCPQTTIGTTNPTTGTTNPTTGPTNQTTAAGGCTGTLSWIGDNYCDDINNNMDCSYDGGDCCGCNVQTSYCDVCGCLDPNGSGGGTTCPQTTTGSTSTTTVTANPTTGPTNQTTAAGGCNDAWIGDNYCDDSNNNMDCSYDSGDCCGCNVDTSYCSVCGCLDPNGSGGGTTCPQTTTGTTNPSNAPTNPTTAGGCTGNTGWIGDDYCDDENNNVECSYDGGDCCGCNVVTSWCSVCACLDPNESGGGTTCPPTTTTTHNPGNYTPALNYCFQTGENMLLIKFFSVLAYGRNLIVGVLTLPCFKFQKFQKLGI